MLLRLLIVAAVCLAVCWFLYKAGHDGCTNPHCHCQGWHEQALTADVSRETEELAPEHAPVTIVVTRVEDHIPPAVIPGQVIRRQTVRTPELET